MKNKQKTEVTLVTAFAKTADGNNSQTFIPEFMKIKLILIFMAFVIKSFAQVSLPYTSDFENEEANLSAFWCFCMKFS